MTLNATYLSKNFAASQVVFTTVNQAECTVDLTDCKEEPILLVDTSACAGDVTVTAEISALTAATAGSAGTSALADLMTAYAQYCLAAVAYAK